MRKITEDAGHAFHWDLNFKRDNTEVFVREGVTTMYLHGNPIAFKCNHGVFISNCGWVTMTTRERLNGVVYSDQCVYIKKGRMYLGRGLGKESELVTDRWLQISKF